MTQTDPIDTGEPPSGSGLPEDGVVRSDEGATPQAPSGLVAFAEAIEAAKGDLAGTLERLAQSLQERDRREILDEMLARERENPGAFLSGALAGFVIGRGGFDFGALREDASHSDAPVDDQEESAQEGASGADDLEPELAEDEEKP